MQPCESITVHKLDHRGREVWHYQGRLLDHAPSSLTLEAFFDRDRQTIGGLTLEPGDRFVETYYTDRWYNVFAIHEGDAGPLKGWYCNIARPARFETGHVFAEDLALDLIVDPRLNMIVLDQEEFEALDISKHDRTRASQALETLRQLASSGEPPFIIPD